MPDPSIGVFGAGVAGKYDGGLEGGGIRAAADEAAALGGACDPYGVDGVSGGNWLPTCDGSGENRDGCPPPCEPD